MKNKNTAKTKTKTKIDKIDKRMNPDTLFYLLPGNVIPNILKHLDRDTRTIMWCLIYYGHKVELWYKWYPIQIL